MTPDDNIGFHWRDGWAFLRLSDGGVRVRRYADDRCLEVAEVGHTLIPEALL